MPQPNNQTAFWEAMKEKYEKRNESLRRQEICLRQRLEQLKEMMDNQHKADDDCDRVPEKLEKPSLVQCLVEKGKNLILGSCKCGNPKSGEEFLCACHITDPETPLNVDSSLCPTTKSNTNVCPNGISDSYNCPQVENLSKRNSTFSLKTTDVYYMDKLADLVKTEKNMQEKIDDLEKREHSYIIAIQELREAMKYKPKNELIIEECKRIMEDLEGENKKLKNDLEDMKLELKHCFERIEGPLKRNLEDEKDKCSKMDEEMKNLHAKIMEKEDNYLKEINEIKAQLCQACCTMVELNSVNSKLKSDLNILENKYANLEDELLKQQLKEAENILKFKSALARRCTPANIQNKGDDSDQELENVARKLSETLKEVCPCIPSGLTDTVKNIKQLTELVDENANIKRKKRKGIIQNEVKNITSHPDALDVNSCFCSSSSLKTDPKTGDFYSEKTIKCKTNEICYSGSISLTDVKNSSKSFKTKKVTIKTKASKGCQCNPPQEEIPCKPCNLQSEPVSQETICSCENVETKRTGPSEEVLVVKNLGTLSASPEEMKKKQKLAIDTTHDLLSIPPADIHVVTTIAKTGSLEIVTEGPPGVIETKVNFLCDGKIEIITKLIDQKNMNTFLDGTLLKLPEAEPETQCTENECYGQCESDSSESDECECEEEKENGDPSNTYKQTITNNFVLVSGFNPLLPVEWKNKEYHDDNADEIDISQISFDKVKYKRKNHPDISDNPSDIFRLCTRPSLTDVENSSKIERKTSLSHLKFTRSEVLETISEGDEYEDSSLIINSNERSIEYESSFPESCDMEVEIIKSSEKSPFNELVTVPVVSEQRAKSYLSNIITLSEDSIFSSSHENIEPVLDLFETESSKKSSSTTFNDCHRPCKALSEIYLELHLRHTNSACELINKKSYTSNILEGNFPIKQSKSLNEKQTNYGKYIKFTRPSIVSIRKLTIDLQKLQFHSESPNIGDFCQWGLSTLKNKKFFKESIFAGLPKEILEPVEIIPKRTCQCYVCHCSQKKEEKGTKKIDTLLDKNHLKKSHSHNCQCVDCLFHSTQKNIEKETEDMVQNLENDNISAKYMEPLQAKDLGKHDKNCTCVDCICNPCNFKRKSKDSLCDCGECKCVNTCGHDYENYNTDLYNFQEQTQFIVMNVGIPCDCSGKCSCEPCMDSSKKRDGNVEKKSVCKKCQQRIAAKTSKKMSQSMDKPKPERVPCIPTASRPQNPPKKSCALAGEGKKEVCDCKVCDCNPCGYSSKARKHCDCKPKKEEPKNTGTKGGKCC